LDHVAVSWIAGSYRSVQRLLDHQRIRMARRRGGGVAIHFGHEKAPQVLVDLPRLAPHGQRRRPTVQNLLTLWRLSRLRPTSGRVKLGRRGFSGGGLLAGGLAFAVAVVFVLFDADIRPDVFVFFDADIDDLIDQMFLLASLAPYAVGACIWGLWPAFKALKAGIRFWRLLRRPGDPHTATVMASKGGGRMLILDFPWDGDGRGYQPLSEVRLALWMKAGMLGAR
jgi:hypothetical protein